ncbi:hypothetical protein MF672_003120 [Actinomadura sp. ATCC 31491]|uniref:Histidine kinase/HSP90-like ATPase domain-containing protein n=1 Tax=Actinomadura luzonensis TaxID=2805427 RepID=A0ABT0FKG0_9ACTN|nr:hypothetical protein [Actinomadura luzonensis]MCK2212792.1 hypothetical protein [Actinomadura luzonensis]
MAPVTAVLGGRGRKDGSPQDPLRHTLAEHLAGWSARSGIAIEIWALPRRPLPATVAELVHGTLDEILEEVERQATARVVSLALTVSFTRSPGRLRLTVSNDGSGTAAEALRARLRGRAAGIAGLGGRLTVNGVPGEGTTTSVTVPLRRARPRPGS